MIEIIDKPIRNDELLKFLGQPFTEMIKFVVDVNREIMGLGGNSTRMPKLKCWIRDRNKSIFGAETSISTKKAIAGLSFQR